MRHIIDESRFWKFTLKTQFFLVNLWSACSNEVKTTLGKKEGVPMCKVHCPVYSVSTVANCILNQGKAQQIEMTNLKLQEFAYFAQGWALARLDQREKRLSSAFKGEWR